MDIQEAASILDHYARDRARQKAIKIALGYLRVCHLANHAGCQIKVDQAIKMLETVPCED